MYPPGQDSCRLCSKVGRLCDDERCVECCLYGNGAARGPCNHEGEPRLRPAVSGCVGCGRDVELSGGLLMSDKMDATIMYLRDAAEHALRAAASLAEQHGYHLQHADASASLAIHHLERCRRQIARALKEEDPELDSTWVAEDGILKRDSFGYPNHEGPS